MRTIVWFLVTTLSALILDAETGAATTTSAAAENPYSGQPIQHTEPACCSSKTVGGLLYSLTSQDDNSAFDCLNRCRYAREDEEGENIYCFAAGPLKVECHDRGTEPVTGTKKPVTEQRGTKDPDPGTGTKNPITEHPAPETKDPEPVTGTKNPITEHPAPGTNDPDPVTATKKPLTPITTTIYTTTLANAGPHLFIGPGDGSSGQSSLLTLPGLTPATCSIPRHPKVKGDEREGGISGYVSTLSDDGAVLCGGRHGGWETSLCYLLTKDGRWLDTPPMQTSRRFASSVRIGGAWWVTGGYNGAGRLATTELYYNNTWHAHINLPQPVAYHCMVQVNSSHTLITGGYTNNGISAGRSAATYLYSDTTGFIKQADMSTARYVHGCALTLDGYAVIAGGRGNSGILDKVEYFSFSTLSWQSGPSLPVSTYGGAMVTTKEGTLFLGGWGDNKKIFLMEKNGNSINQWQWREVGEMSSRRVYFSAMIMEDMYGCNKTG